MFCSQAKANAGYRVSCTLAGPSGAVFSDAQTSETPHFELGCNVSLYRPEPAARDELRAGVVQGHQSGEGFLEQHAGCCVGRQCERNVGEPRQNCGILHRSMRR